MSKTFKEKFVSKTKIVKYFLIKLWLAFESISFIFLINFKKYSHSGRIYFNILVLNFINIIETVIFKIDSNSKLFYFWAKLMITSWTVNITTNNWKTKI